MGLCSFPVIYLGLIYSDGEGNGTPLQYSCLENPMDGGAWCAAVHGVAKSRARQSDFTFTFHFHALEKEMATHSSVLAWRIPGTGEPGGLPSMGSHRVRHDWSDLAATCSEEFESEVSSVHVIIGRILAYLQHLDRVDIFIWPIQVAECLADISVCWAKAWRNWNGDGFFKVYDKRQKT